LKKADYCDRINPIIDDRDFDNDYTGKAYATAAVLKYEEANSLFRWIYSLFVRRKFPDPIKRGIACKALESLRDLAFEKPRIPCSQFATGLCRTCRA
jgi:hypothetical protein